MQMNDCGGWLALERRAHGRPTHVLRCNSYSMNIIESSLLCITVFISELNAFNLSPN